MMSPLHAAILGLIEGMTEFVPVSSTGHLILAAHYLGHTGPAADAFEIVIQLGAVLACAVYYKDILAGLVKGLVANEPGARRLFLSLACGFIPTAIAGLLFHKAIEARLFGPIPVAAALLVGGVAMVVADRIQAKKPGPISELDQIGPGRAALIGVVQCASLWPGTSRSMSAILGGQIAGLQTRVAADFAFLLGIPTLGAACAYKLMKSYNLLLTGVGRTPLLLGLGVAFVSGYLVIALFLRLLKRTGLGPFGVYRIVLALIVFALLR